ncbi:histidine phosphatase family protein [Cellulomonas triticagri]|uniref:Histidine phosphatase family protein n=1 Tax=Cellulomonas triticagri TaxID=2483352 RepID=A0A3M2J7V5_9CELL|nr:histidine phosphatase family protein [Cellulomonas triticagri]RMI06568.1 histidine phosphatase family protein [Cellulomonas triticagri]
MRLHLVRHGQTGSNLIRALDTAEPGAPLTDEGQRQAEAVGTVLATEPLDAVYASVLTRTQQTAAALAAPHGLRVEVRAGLREVIAGDLEMRTDDDAVLQYLGTMMAWADGDLDAVMPGGESGRATLARFDAVVDEVRASGAAVAALVSHGAMIRMWAITRAANLGVRDEVVQTLDNTGVVTLEEDGAGGWYATRWQDHLVPHATPTQGDGPAGEPLPL